MQNQTTNGNGHPQWIKQMLETYQNGVANAFIIHFNTGDYVTPSKPINAVKYLSGIWAKKEIVVTYSRDRGIEFGNDEQKRLAMDTLGLSQQPQTQDNFILSALGGIGGNNAPAQLPNDPAGALPLIDQLLRSGRSVAVIIDGAELVVPPADLATMQPADRIALATIRRWGIGLDNPVFLVTNNLSSIHPELRAASCKFEALEVGLPNVETRYQFVEEWLNLQYQKWHDQQEAIKEDCPDYVIPEYQPLDFGDLTTQSVANSTAGLSLLHIEDILLRADAKGKLTQDLIWDRKVQIVKSEFADVLEIIEPKATFRDIGGLSHVKEFFKKNVINPIRKGRKGRVPMGVLMTGPAGTGKTITAFAVATEAGINAVKLNIGGNIASKWQGEGERNLSKALSAIKSLTPCLVFIDEVDQAVRRGDGNGGSQQDNRIFQMLLEFMSDTDHRGDVIFLAATNRPDQLDAAFRVGRFDKNILFPIPEPEDRADLAKVFSRKQLGVEVEVSQDFIRKTEGWTGAELEGLAVKAAELVEDDEITPAEAMEKAVSKVVARTKDIEFMTAISLQVVNDYDYLPAKYRAMLENREALDEKVKQGQKAEGYRQKREI